MEESALAALKERYDFEAWFNRNTLDESLFVDHYLVTDETVPGARWKLLQANELRGPEGERYQQTMWQTSPSDPESLLRVDIYECNSRADAHERVLELLANFQLPLVERRPASRLGDVAFGGPQDNALIFTRGNLVIVLLNAGRKRTSLRNLAGRIDQALVGKPEPATRGVEEAAAIRRFEPEQPRVKAGDPVPLEVEMAESVGPVTRKFFARGGEVMRERGRLIFRGTEPGRPEIELYTVDPRNRVDSSRVQVELE